MPLGPTDYLGFIREMGYPADPILTDNEILQAVTNATTDLTFEYPLQTYGAFTTVNNQQVYDLFNPVPNLATQQGVLPGGLRVLDIVWSPVQTGQSLDVFGIAPFLQGLTIAPGEITTYSFQTPTDFWMWDLNWNSFVKRFGPQGFEHVNNAPGSPIRVYPVPRDTGIFVFVQYTKPRTVEALQNEDQSWFLKFVEAYCCYAIHHKMNMVAGTKIGDLGHDGKSALYWKLEGDRNLAVGWEMFHRRRYDSMSPVQRY